MREKLILVVALGGLACASALAFYLYQPLLPSFWPLGADSENTGAHGAESASEADGEAHAEAEPGHKSGGHLPEIRQETHDEADAGHGDGEPGASETSAHPLELAMPQTQSRIVELVRKLHLVQSAAAAGTTIAGFSQRDALRDIEAELSKVDAHKVSDQELHSIAVYVLSGGDPLTVKGILEKLPKSHKLHSVLEGAVAFAEAQREEAQKQLADIDLSAHPRTLAARLALAQAQLIDEDDGESRSEKLMIAANLSPGTLVEEAATRRLVTLFGSKSEVGRFLKWSERYARRFPKSLYMPEFEIAFAVGVQRLEREGKRIDEKKLFAILTRLNKASSTRILLKLSQKSAIVGLQSLCVNAATMGLEHFNEPGEVEMRFKLYKSACSVVNDAKTAVVELIALDSSKLAEADAGLRNDAVTMARAILAENAAPEVETEWRSGDAEPEASNDPLLASVAQQLEATKETLVKADQ